MTGELDVAGLAEVARAATPGIWKLWGMTVMADQDGTSNVETAVEVAATFHRDENGKPRTFDAQHIATFDPPTVLALIDRLAAAESAVERVRALADEWERNDLGTDRFCAADLKAALDQGDGSAS